MTLGLCTQIFCTVIRCKKTVFCTHNDFYGCKCAIVCVTYGVLGVIFVMSLMCLFAFVFVVFISISTNKVCEFSLPFCTVMFYVAPCKILHLHLLHMGVAESGCKDPAEEISNRSLETFVSITKNNCNT